MGLGMGLAPHGTQEDPPLVGEQPYKVFLL